MARDLSQMTPEEKEMVLQGAKILLAGGTNDAEPEIPADVQKFMDDNNYTIEAKKPTVIGAVDTATAVRSTEETQLDGIGPQMKAPAGPAIIHESTKRTKKDFLIVNAVGILTQGRDYEHFLDSGLEMDVLKAQKAFSREPSEEIRKEIKEREQQLKDLNIGSEVAGGFFIPEEVNTEMIKNLRGQEIWMNMGVDYMPNSPKYQSWPKEGDDPNITWTGDTPPSDIEDTDMEYGEVTLSLHQMACLVKIRLNLLKYARDNVEKRVRNQIVQSMAVEQTKVGLRGTGGKQPLGLFNLPSMVSYTTDLGSAIPTFNNLLDLQSVVRGRDGVVDETRSAWVMSETYLGLFKKSKTGTAQYDYIVDLTNMPPNRILGLPVYTSSQIRTDLGTGSDSRLMLVGDKNQIMLADGGQTEITILKELFARKFQVGLLASREIDFGVQQEKQLQFLTGIKAS